MARSEHGPIGRDWRRASSYADLAASPRRAWAWEFLRRNPQYRHAVTNNREGPRPSGMIAERVSVLLLERPCRGALAWGLLGFEDPDLDAMTARPFWDPVTSPSVLPLIASVASEDDAALRLDRIEVSMRILKTPDRMQHILFSDNERAFQLAITGADVTSGDAALRLDALPPLGALPRRLDGLRRLADLHETGRLRPRLYPPYGAARRLQRVLQALDGSLEAASQHEVATALFGEVRVARDWSDSSGNLRDQVRRAIRRGRVLMATGYRRFL